MSDQDRDGAPSPPQHGQGAEATAAEFVEMARKWLENINASATVHVWADEAALVEALSALLTSVAKAAAEREREESDALFKSTNAMLTMFEHSMFGSTNVDGQRWEVGKTDLQIVPDGSYMLSDVRKIVAKVIRSRAT